MQTGRCNTDHMFWTEYSRDVVLVTGPDAFTYLQSQLSQELRPLQVGQSVWSFVLQPTGKVDVLLRVWRTADDTFVLDTDDGFGEALVARLNRFKIRVKAEISVLDWQCLAVRGADLAGIEGLPSWGDGVDLLGAVVHPPHGVPHGDAQQLLAARVAAVWAWRSNLATPFRPRPAWLLWRSASPKAATRGRNWSSGWTAAAPPHLGCCRWWRSQRAPGRVSHTSWAANRSV